MSTTVTYRSYKPMCDQKMQALLLRLKKKDQASHVRTVFRGTILQEASIIAASLIEGENFEMNLKRLVVLADLKTKTESPVCAWFPEILKALQDCLQPVTWELVKKSLEAVQEPPSTPTLWSDDENDEAFGEAIFEHVNKNFSNYLPPTPVVLAGDATPVLDHADVPKLDDKASSSTCQKEDVDADQGSSSTCKEETADDDETCDQQQNKKQKRASALTDNDHPENSAEEAVEDSDHEAPIASQQDPDDNVHQNPPDEHNSESDKEDDDFEKEDLPTSADESEEEISEAKRHKNRYFDLEAVCE